MRSLDDLPGWASDDPAPVLAAIGVSAPDAKTWLDSRYCIGATTGAAFTGYYEPVLPAARLPDARFRFPIHRFPANGAAKMPRAQLLAGDRLSGHEIAWLDNVLDAFLLQVQGSGRLRFADGTMMRVGYAGSNAQPYTSIGKLLVARGLVPPESISIAAIRAYVDDHPKALPDLLNENRSYVFFREINGLHDSAGPIGAAGAPLTAMRSVAVDPDHIALGTLLWIEVDGSDPIRTLAVAQDTGSAIKGAGRIDLFFGTGDAAGARAGAFCCTGRITPLLPKAASA